MKVSREGNRRLFSPRRPTGGEKARDRVPAEQARDGATIRDVDAGKKEEGSTGSGGVPAGRASPGRQATG
ncbi:MAG TPA: hypothetical protein PLI31_05675 [Methanoregulaceae archaeon]|nr:hypothetical protein [Methanoregulaceae archaeon]